MTGENLLEIRRRLTMTQSELAARLGVHYTTVARWESGRTEIPRPVELALREINRTEGQESSS